MLSTILTICSLPCKQMSNWNCWLIVSFMPVVQLVLELCLVCCMTCVVVTLKLVFDSSLSGPTPQDVKNQVKTFGDLLYAKWNELKDFKCLNCILLLVSCNDSMVFIFLLIWSPYMRFCFVGIAHFLQCLSGIISPLCFVHNLCWQVYY